MKKLISQIASDTLKKDGKWSRTSFTMLTAWVMAIFMAFWDLFRVGFHFEVFITFVAVATGVKIADAFTRKISKDANTGTISEQN